MVKQFYTYLFLLISSLGFSQTEIVHYFPQYLDTITNQLSKPELKEKYQAIITNGDTVKDGFYKTYFETSEQIKLDGNYAKGEKNGDFISYYENGNPKWTRSYQKGIQLGKEVYFYPNGKENYHADYKLTKGSQVRFTKYYPDNIKWAECSLDHNQIQGAYSEYFRNGKIASITEFQSGQKNGGFQTYYDNGQIQEKGSFKNGLLNDSLILYTDQDYVIKKALFVDGKVDGNLLEFYPNVSQLKKSSNYNLDTLHGANTSYYPNGQVETSCTYLRGFLDQDYIVYHDNGQLNIKVFYTQAQKQGPFIEYNKEGDIIRTGKYKNNELDGEVKGFYPDNILHWSHHFNMGIKTGVHQDYWQTGKLKISRSYDDGKLRIESNYSEKGIVSKKVRYSYQISQRSGKEEVISDVSFFDKKGTISESRSYLDKQKHGTWKSFYFNGKPSLLSNYKFNKLQGDYITYYSSGKTEIKGRYSRNVKSGEWHTFDKSGKLTLTAHYMKGRLHGEWIKYTGKKVIIEKGKYSFGKKEGWWDFYDSSGKLLNKKLYQKDKLIKEESN